MGRTPESAAGYIMHRVQMEYKDLLRHGGLHKIVLVLCAWHASTKLALTCVNCQDT